MDTRIAFNVVNEPDDPAGQRRRWPGYRPYFERWTEHPHLWSRVLTPFPGKAPFRRVRKDASNV